MKIPAFRIKTRDTIFEYRPSKTENTFYIKSWIDNKEQPTRIVSKEEAESSYQYCSSMWMDFDFEYIVD